VVRGELIAYMAILGLLIGSFLTVVVDRVPDGRSILAPRSSCGGCGEQLGVLDLVPVVSWLMLRGKCRHCAARIGVEPLVVELVTASAFAAIAARFGVRLATVGFCFAAAGLIGLSVIDLHTQRLPREITYVTAALSLPLLTVDALIRNEERRVVMMVVGSALALIFLGGVRIASRGGMGDGDVRLSPLLGALLGWVALPLVAAGMFIAFLVGAVVGLAVKGISKDGRREAIPFGPFLAFGTVAAWFVGNQLVDAVWQA
jgi:leader peptidase (prepilin peptidase)/N-methyltransferase